MSGGLQAAGLAQSYAGGRKRVRQLAENHLRLGFINQIGAAAARRTIRVSNQELDFITRIVNTTNADFPNFSAGDANVADQLRRHYQARLDQTCLDSTGGQPC